MNALDRHRALLAAATPGPWYYDDSKEGTEGDPCLFFVDPKLGNIAITASGTPFWREGDFPLIAAAVNAHPLLLDLWAAALDVTNGGHCTSSDGATVSILKAPWDELRAILAKLEAMP